MKGFVLGVLLTGGIGFCTMVVLLTPQILGWMLERKGIRNREPNKPNDKGG